MMASFFPEKKKEGRYNTPIRVRKWTRNEDHILRAILLTRNSTGAYANACGFLCRILNRQPNVNENVNPSHIWWRERRMNLITNRLWDIIVGYRGFVIDPIYRDAERCNMPWTVVEVQVVLKRWITSEQPNKLKTLDHLALVLSRMPEEVNQAVTGIRSTSVDTFLTYFGSSRTTSTDPEEAVPQIQRFLNLDLNNIEPNVLRHQWRGLMAALE